MLRNYYRKGFGKNMKKIVSLLLSAALAATGFTGLAAAEGGTGATYKYVDLSAYANCIGFAEEPLGDKKYTVPDYIGNYNNANSGTDKKDLGILNKTAFDAKKDDSGLIYDNNGIPFKVSTALDGKNIILLSKKSSSGDEISGLDPNGSVTVAVPEGKYKSVSLLADITKGRTCDVVMTYSDNTKLEKKIKFVKHAESFAESAVTGKVTFTYTAPSEADADAGKKSAMLVKGTGVDTQTLSMPVYTVALDKEKKLSSISISGVLNSEGLAILAISLEAASEAELLAEKIDALPEADAVNFGNYKTYKDAVLAVKASLDAGVTVDSTRTEKAEALIALIEKFDSDPAEEVKYLIDQLPGAGEIASNYEEYAEKLAEISEKLTDEIKAKIDQERLDKFSAVGAAVKTESDKAELKNLIAVLPEASDITDSNYSKYETTLEKIAEMLEAGVFASEADKEKYEAVKAAVSGVKYTYSPWVMMDLSKSYNAKLYGTSDMTTDDPTVRTPAYMGTYLGKADGSQYPQKILNKNLLSKNPVVYGDSTKIPMSIDTSGGILLGACNPETLNVATSQMEIPITQGNYESVSILTCSINQITAEQFKFQINYTDGTTDVDPAWTLPDFGVSIEALKNKDIEYNKETTLSVADSVLFKLDRTSEETMMASTLWYERNGTAYTKRYGADVALPIVTLAADPQKTVKSITLEENDRYRCTALFSVTAKLPDQETLKGIIESKISAINKDNLAAESDNIYAVINMMKAYEGKTGSGEISGAADFAAIRNTFENSIVEVESVGTKTDLKNITTTVKFKNAVDTEKLADYVTLTLDGAAFSDYKLEIKSGREADIVIKNDLNYDKAFKLTLSGKLQAATDKSFKLGADYSYEFAPEAPVSIEKFDVTCETVSGGEKISFDVSVKNNTVSPNTNCVISICVHDEADTLVKSFVKQGKIAPGESIGKSDSVTLPSGKYSVTCFVLDGFATMDKLTLNAEK